MMNDGVFTSYTHFVQLDFETCYAALNIVFNEEKYYQISINSAQSSKD